MRIRLPKFLWPVWLREHEDVVKNIYIGDCCMHGMKHPLSGTGPYYEGAHEWPNDRGFCAQCHLGNDQDIAKPFDGNICVRSVWACRKPVILHEIAHLIVFRESKQREWAQLHSEQWGNVLRSIGGTLNQVDYCGGYYLARRTLIEHPSCQGYRCWVLDHEIDKWARKPAKESDPIQAFSSEEFFEWKRFHDAKEQAKLHSEISKKIADYKSKRKSS